MEFVVVFLCAFMFRSLYFEEIYTEKGGENSLYGVLRDCSSIFLLSI